MEQVLPSVQSVRASPLPFIEPELPIASPNGSFFTDDESDREELPLGSVINSNTFNEPRFYEHFPNYLPPIITPLAFSLPNSLLNPPNSILKF